MERALGADEATIAMTARLEVNASLPTEFSRFKIIGFRSAISDEESVALVKRKIDPVKPVLVALILILNSTSVLARAERQHSLEVAPSVDLSRYAGKWYEVARLPNWFQKKCAGEVTANYSQLDGGQLNVINECRQRNGQIARAEGKARLADKGGPNSKLEVRFAPALLGWLPVVWGDYWIIDLAPDYSYSVVGAPDRKYLWILSRTPQMDEAIYQRIVARAAAWGFDVSRLVKTPQAG